MLFHDKLCEFFSILPGLISTFFFLNRQIYKLVFIEILEVYNTEHGALNLPRSESV